MHTVKRFICLLIPVKYNIFFDSQTFKQHTSHSLYVPHGLVLKRLYLIMKFMYIISVWSTLKNIRSETSTTEASTRGRSEPGLYNLRYDPPYQYLRNSWNERCCKWTGLPHQQWWRNVNSDLVILQVETDRVGLLGTARNWFLVSWMWEPGS